MDRIYGDKGKEFLKIVSLADIDGDSFEADGSICLFLIDVTNLNVELGALPKLSDY